MSTALAIGVFDGLHLGHRALLERALARAREASGRPIVLSFDPHPDVVLSRGAFRIRAPLTPLPEKRRRLLAMGVDDLVVLPFTRELASLEPEEFVDRYLVTPYAPSALVVGEGFALGRNRTGTVERLRAIGRARGFEVEAVPLVQRDGGPISSTRIRDLLVQGRVAEAGRLLGRSYELEGRVVRGEGIGRSLGYPTANLRLHHEKFLPADGIYAARAQWEGSPWRLAAMSIGVRPTFDGRVRTVEVHVLDWSGDLVGRALEVELVDWLRPEIRFESSDALVQAMGQDVAETRRRLGPEARGVTT